MTLKITPAEKAARTRAYNKANAIYESTIEPQYQEWVEAVDRFCPPRDAVIAGLEAKRDEAIAKIEAEYQKEYDAVMESFRNLMQPTQDKLDKARSEAWAVLRESLAKADA